MQDTILLKDCYLKQFLMAYFYMLVHVNVHVHKLTGWTISKVIFKL